MNRLVSYAVRSTKDERTKLTSLGDGGEVYILLLHGLCVSICPCCYESLEGCRMKLKIGVLTDGDVVLSNAD